MSSSKAGMKAGQLREPGIMTCIDGTKIDLTRPVDSDFDLFNIAWGLGATQRYGGHIRQEWTVAHHSIVMSYAVPKGFALEALFHDAAESYMGDIIWPVKELFPELREFEDSLLSGIMRQFGVIEHGEYTMSEVVKLTDIKMMEHECFEMEIRPGIYHKNIDEAWIKAVKNHGEWWDAPRYAFLQRYDDLTGSKSLDLNKLEQLWFPKEYAERVEYERAIREAKEEQARAAEEIAGGVM